GAGRGFPAGARRGGGRPRRQARPAGLSRKGQGEKAMKSFEKLIASLRRFPGIGPKQAERIALYLFRASKPEIEALVGALRDVKERMRTCSVCLNYSEDERCAICRDPGR